MLKFRNLFLTILCLGISFATCSAQTPATFRTQTYTERPSESADAVDVNNDGVLDLVQFLPPTARQPSTIAFTVRVANGNGSFRDPAVYSFSSPYAFDRIEVVPGDFNGDGNVDLAVGFNGGDQLMLFLGKGDGTFQAKDVTIALPSGQKFGILFPAADFNGDGKLDLVATTSPTGSISALDSIYLIPGDGKGNFGNPVLLYMSPAKHFIDSSNIAAGDFDGDGRADVAFLDDYNCDQGFCSSTLHVLYNDGDSRFTDTATSASFTIGEEFIFSAGDLNSDGRTDIFGIKRNNSNQLEVLYGQADRTFHIYDLATPTLDEGFAMADFNGDTRMDLVALDQNSSGTSFQLQFFLADSGEGTFTQQAFGLPNMVGVSDSPLVGDFNSDTRPDVISLIGDLITPTVIADTLNTTSSGNWGGCAYPKAAMGIHVCAPGSSTTASAVTFKASANSFGQLRKMELWIDGKKVAEQYHVWGSRAWFNFSDALASGTHRGVIFAADIDNRLQKTVFNFTVK